MARHSTRFGKSYLRLACAYSGGALLFLDPWRRPSFVVVALPARRYRAGRGISLLILAHSAQDVEQLRLDIVQHSMRHLCANFDSSRKVTDAGHVAQRLGNRVERGVLVGGRHGTPHSATAKRATRALKTRAAQTAATPSCMVRSAI